MIIFALLAFLLLEGIGIKYGREIVLYSIVFLSVINFIFLITKKEFTRLPIGMMFAWLMFIFFTGVSTIYSTNPGKSFYYLLLYFSCFIVFIYSNLFKEKIMRYLIPSLIVLSILFCVYSVIIIQFKTSFNKFLLPDSGYQFVYSSFGSHNHLGDFLLIPLIIIFFELIFNGILLGRIYKKLNIRFSKIINVLLFLFFLPYFIFSFSRSAYGSFVVITMWIMWNINKILSWKKVICFLIINFTVVILFFAAASDFTYLKTVNLVREYFLKQESLSYKSFFGERGEYYRIAFQSMKDNLLLGVGPGNFQEASRKYKSEKMHITHTAHNIFLEVFTENGLLAGIFFLGIIFLIMKSSQKGIYFILFITLLLNFQTDYTYRIYSYLILFFLIGGITYGEKKVKSG